jgi:MOSC domain-containing protein YiiM
MTGGVKAPTWQSPTVGRVASLHLHPPEPGTPFRPVPEIEVVAGRGIAGNPRYFGRPTRRQVTLIGREQIAEHAATLGLETIAPGAVRSNIETLGVDLMAWLDRDVQVGDAVLRFYAPRTPCHKMDAVCPGLRAQMEDGRQGVLAQVRVSGRIREGDIIRLAKTPANP